MRILSHDSGRRPAFAAGCVLLLALLASTSDRAALADVIVLANRTGSQLTMRFQPRAGRAQQLLLPVGDVRPMFVDGPAQVDFAGPGRAKRYQLDANSAYFFGRDARGIVDMQKIGLGDDTTTAPGRRLPSSVGGAASVTIPVKILVDEEEPARQFFWEQRLRRRIEAASAILEKHSRVALRVVAVGTWNSDNATSDFGQSLSEFEREVNPLPARLAIGFTSQFELVRGRVHIAGTRGPMHAHILIRESSPGLSEPERLEFLVHELGHYLGASHSPEKTSVMRPVLGDHKAGRRDFQIRFDPVNTLIIAMVGEEMRRRNVRKFADLTGSTQRQLQGIYGALSRALPNDPAGGQYLRLTETATNAPLVAGAKRVLRAIVHAAVSNRALLPGEARMEGQPSQRSGDELAEYLVQRAAIAADTLPDDVAPAALLVALAIGLDDSNLLLSQANTRSVVQAVESPDERTVRLAMLGEPTMLERRDVLSRFFASAYLAAALGADAAKEAGLAREFANVQNGGRFSFVLLAVDRAGVRFGDDLKRGRLPTLASRFSMALFVPPIDGLPERLSAEQFAAQFGAADDNRFQHQMFIIDERINSLPFYRTTGTSFDR